MSESSAKRPGLIRRLWRFFWSPTTVYSLGALLIVGFIGGIMFWGSFNWAMEATNNEQFCIGCHEMRDNVYAEYQGTVHHNNHSGVRATCPDCHVPKEWQHKVIRKVQATKELYGHFVTGVVDTPEKFGEHRLALASRVWRAMKSTDSRECRNCHNFEFMDFTIQEGRAAASHQQAIDEGRTCIDCHQGIAHDLPAGYLDRYREVVKELAMDGVPSARTQTSSVTRIREYLASLND
ncbi:MAG: NapC/NirT family cytochrome c [Rhodobiaceae bacterium]|nr:NapC/NirT family cytochrome c [Rhodobiaceae bacterium]MCC0014466.1 NapC/NirT family cytochrome c [Rhodobiaceae bacterium]MCC0062247.1 NapC/NirT family cytochrome c [Rhodobiaceae bacterium]